MSRWPCLALATVLAGCAGEQSALEPHGPAAESILTLTWVMVAGGTAIFLLVCAFIAAAVLLPVERRRWLASRRVILGWGLAFPVVTLFALLVYGLSVTSVLLGPSASEPLRVAVVGEQWWWRVTYPGTPGAVTANEIHIPAGRPVEVTLDAADVIHSFWVPNLAGKIDMIPGRTNRLRIQADRPGTFRGQCAEFCGGPHTLMAFHVVAVPPDEFDAWLVHQAGQAIPPEMPQTRRGQELFQGAGCGACHTVRGTMAAGAIGPDLTHVAERAWIAAGTLANDAAGLARWIAEAQHVKPDNRMPSFPIFADADRDALVAYLRSLR